MNDFKWGTGVSDPSETTDLAVENALLRAAIYADGRLLQFARLTGPTLRAAGCHDAADRLIELIAAADLARFPLRQRGIFTNG